MMISYRRKFVFIDIVKIAGTSIREVLGQRYFGGTGKHHFILNQTWDFNSQNKIDEKFKDYFKFTFVRNPYDRLVSLYCWGKQLKPREPYTNMEFEEWIIFLYNNWNEHKCYENIKPMIHWIRDDENKIMVDFIGRFENLQEDWLLLCKRIVSRFDKTTDFSRFALPHRYQTQHQHYSHYYNEKTRKMAEEMYGEDIKLFGYIFS